MPMVDVEGGRLHYISKGKGIPLVLLHPPVMSRVNFTYQLNDLSRYFRVIVPDIRGHGRSDPSVEPLTYPLIVRDITRLLNQLNIEKAFVGGYSVGGSIVLEYMLTYPHRCLGGILMGGISEASDRRLKRMISLGIRLSKPKTYFLLARLISRTNADRPSMYRNMIQDARRANIRNVHQYFQYSLKYNCTDRLSSIQSPVLLVYGAKDTPFHAYGKMMHDRLPNSEYKHIAHVKHHLPTKASLELNDLITQFIFLNKNRSETVSQRDAEENQQFSFEEPSPVYDEL